MYAFSEISMIRNIKNNVIRSEIVCLFVIVLFKCVNTINIDFSEEKNNSYYRVSY